MSPEVLAQLYVLRAQLEIAIRLLEGEPEALVEDETGCEHPEEKRVDATTMGGPRKFHCLVCGAEVEGVA